MNTQKVEPCEFVAGLCSDCGASEQLGCEGWVAPADRVQSLADQVEALTKERDALALGVDQWKVDFHELSLERDALMAAAKLAVAALDDWYYGVNQDRPKASVFAALQALKAAGVQ